MLLFLQPARDEVAALPLDGVVDERILHRAAALDGLGVEPGPEEGEVSDVAVIFAPSPAPLGKLLRLDDHLGELSDGPAGFVAQSINRVEMDEAAQKRGEVIGEGRVGHAEMGEEGVVRQPPENTPERMAV